MDTITLDHAYVDHGVPHISFWNGRVLTAEDLRAEQAANQLGRNRLGRAIGSGVISGLAVRAGADPARVEVTAGLAVDRTGQVIELPVDVDLALVVPATAARGDGVFAVCEPVASAPTGTGVYLLVVRAASETRSSVAGVPALGSGTATAGACGCGSSFASGVASECGPRFTVDGVSFRLVGLDPVQLATTIGHDAADLAVLGELGGGGAHPAARNVLAHLLLGSRGWATRLADPFGAPPDVLEPGPLGVLLASQVCRCEVPIAVLTWEVGGVDLIDVWAVRRSAYVAPELSSLQGLGGRLRELSGRAAYCQFADQLSRTLADLTGAQRSSYRLKQSFRYLPAAGLVPIARGTRAGFSGAVFDGLLTRGPLPLPAGRVGALLDESVHHAAVDTVAGDVVTIYAVRHASGEVDHLLFCTDQMEVVEVSPTICGVFPSGPLVLGQRIQINGRHFGVTDDFGSAEFDGILAPPRAGSSDTRLVVDVPVNLQVDPEGSLVSLALDNGFGSDSVPLVVRQPSGPVGELRVVWKSVVPAKLVTSNSALVRYQIESAVVPDVDVDLALSGTAAVVPTARLFDDSGNPIAPPVHLAPGESLAVNVAVAAVPKMGFTLRLRASVGDIVAEDSHQFRPDQVTPASDPDILFGRPELVGPVDGELEGTTVRLGDDVSAQLALPVRFRAVGRYAVEVSVDGGAGWEVGLIEPPPVQAETRGVIALNAIDLLLGRGADRQVVLSLLRPAGAGVDGLEIVVRRQTDNRRTSASFSLEPL